ncbi:hypothetical protein [Aquibacillus rhizosphaerae]|uniref:YfhD family protein n=1 Tax=Aquibacillus rhizosphaerae TaxID=3051431 RepID=A0ABT7L4B0_9BACI|nr:hypothetical protein [Aquibacillus sp. LR5S19]MDL4840708.1 hypothetical protein [Aquibacillus sp. LR5S19]
MTNKKSNEISVSDALDELDTVLEEEFNEDTEEERQPFEQAVQDNVKEKKRNHPDK